MTTKADKTLYETVIGLEVHLQFNTKTKIFCGCVNDFGRDPNTCTCPVCLGLPGTLPVFNRQALEFAVKVALGLSCEVNELIKFDRKNYYYPDLPKGYQISQFDHPIAKNGHLLIDTPKGKKTIRIHRAHLEEDAGKLIHDTASHSTLVDYNRTGTPLMEIVTEPDLRSPQEAYDYLQALKLTLQYLDVSDCDMEKGSLRCDANISLRPWGEEKLGTKAELKNMNSFKAVKTALEYEVLRQEKVLSSGGEVQQETRLWNEDKQTTFSMRSKEDAHDYRYFPEPDLVPFILDHKTVDDIKAALPEPPFVKLERLQKEFELSEYDARILIQDRTLASLFEDTFKIFPQAKAVCNWITGPLLKELNERKISVEASGLTGESFAGLLMAVEQGTISQLVGKDVLTQMIDSGNDAPCIIKEAGLAQVSDEGALEKEIDQVFQENRNVVDQIKSGKESALGFLVGQVMKKTKGKANPKMVNEIIKRRLEQ